MDTAERLHQKCANANITQKELFRQLRQDRFTFSSV